MHLTKKNWFVTFAVAGMGLACGANAYATGIEYTWNGTSTAWAADADWTITNLNGNSMPAVSARYPGAASRTNDLAVIANYANDPVLSAGSVTVATLQLQSGASLAINNVSLTVAAAADADFQMVGSTRIDINNAGGTLALQGASRTFDVGGIIAVNDSGSELRILSNNITLEPYSTFTGTILGGNDAAEVNIVSGAKLTSEIAVEGRMAFGDQGTFENLKYVLANVASGVIAFGPDLTLQDAYNGGAFVWTAEGNSAELAFYKEFAPDGVMHVSTGSSNNGIISVHDVLVVSPYGLSGLDHDLACGTNVFCDGENAFVVWNTNDEAYGCPFIP